MTAPSPRAAVEALALIEAHVEAVEAAGMDPDAPVPPPVDLTGVELTPAELERARLLLARLEAASERLRGLQHRLRGELAAMARPRRETRRRAPRTLDISA